LLLYSYGDSVTEGADYPKSVICHEKTLHNAIPQPAPACRKIDPTTIQAVDKAAHSPYIPFAFVLFRRFTVQRFAYLEKARERIPSVPVLINMISRRVKQLQLQVNGVSTHRPLVKPDDAKLSYVEIALKEIAEGKLAPELAAIEEVDAVVDSAATDIFSI
jgi:DNA-directed RNA polymerase subunit K/omega